MGKKHARDSLCNAGRKAFHDGVTQCPYSAELSAAKRWKNGWRMEKNRLLAIQSQGLFAETQKWIDIAKGATPEEWVLRIQRLFLGWLRIKVACLFYWDIYGDDPAADRPTEFDPLLALWPQAGIDIERGVIVNALVELGYPRHLAERRV